MMNKLKSKLVYVVASALVILGLGLWYLLNNNPDNTAYKSNPICDAYLENLPSNAEVGAPGFGTFDQLKKASTTIVRAKVVNCARATAEQAKHSITEADYTFDVQEVFKGDAAKGELKASLVVQHKNGEWSLPLGVPKLAEGQEVVLFLWEPLKAKEYKVIHGGMTIGVKYGWLGEYKLNYEYFDDNTFMLFELR